MGIIKSMMILLLYEIIIVSNETDYVKFQIGIVDFGNFLDSFVREVNKQKARLRE